MSVEDACRHYPPDKELPYTREYSERVVGGIHEVEMRIAETGMTLHWWIDPEKGWNPIRTQLSVEGRVVDESRVEYQKCGDTWFPRSVDYVDASGAVMSRIEVEQARINSPDLPTELFPEDIGLGIGMSVTVTNETGGEMHSYMGHGKTLVDEEYLKLYAAGRVVQDPRLAERASVLQARAAAKRAATDQAVPAPVPASAPAVPLLRILEDDWERYTREFIQRYSLDASQIQTAELILRECQEQRSKYLRQKARQISSIRERATGGPNAEARRKALAELDELMEPLTRIFEAQLKPRLDRLPTRAQRQGVKEPGADENRP